MSFPMLGAYLGSRERQRPTRGSSPRPFIRFGVLVGSLLFSACHTTPDTQPSLVPVSGRLVYRGQPVAGALVVLYPWNSAAPAGTWKHGFPRATTAADGLFAIGTCNTGDGAPIGQYVLLVTWGDAGARESGERFPAVPEGELPVDRFGGRFSDPQQARLTCVVTGPRVELGRIELDW